MSKLDDIVLSGNLTFRENHYDCYSVTELYLDGAPLVDALLAKLNADNIANDEENNIDFQGDYEISQKLAGKFICIHVDNLVKIQNNMRKKRKVNKTQ